MDFEQLCQSAREILGRREISENISCGDVAAALVTDRENIYRGVCIDTSSSMGFCAEHAAVSAMLAAGESRVEKIVALGPDGRVWPPCGRCRELLWQLGNPDCQVMVSENEIVPLRALLPFRECL